MLDYMMIAIAMGFGALVLAAIYAQPDDYEKFKQQCRDAGMDFQETQAALAIRIAFVRLRRRASDLCLERNGEISNEQIAEIVNQEAQCLHTLHGFEAAKSYIAWANCCPDTEILYPDALEVHMSWVRSQLKPLDLPEHVRRQAAEDFHAALRVVRR